MPPPEALSMKRRRTDTSPELDEERDGATEQILPEKVFNHSPYSGIAPGRTQHTPSPSAISMFVPNINAAGAKVTGFRYYSAGTSNLG